ncbi:hypothetical protein, partial [Bacillus velezensis]|uniref:hypothetical protein n=1 Tax=Bacillus velezensis TaxID=492670 RepID=UPI00316FB657
MTEQIPQALDIYSLAAQCIGHFRQELKRNPLTQDQRIFVLDANFSPLLKGLLKGYLFYFSVTLLKPLYIKDLRPFRVIGLLKVIYFCIKAYIV